MARPGRRCILSAMYTFIMLVALVAGISAQCFDENANCPTWAKHGFCTNPYYSYLVSSCQKSCNRCPTRVGDCGPNGRRAVGPLFRGRCPMIGYGPNAAGDQCCPTVNVDERYQIGPTFDGTCPVGYVVVYGLDYDVINQGVCVDLNS